MTNSIHHDICKEAAPILLAWFAGHRRDLPWRETYDPYAVLVSEIMLQQTQMERGVTYFKRWMDRFPTLESLAAASPEAVLKAWEGLGYYSRARNLHTTAQILVAEGRGIPSDLDALCRLPGIGPYTAGAIASIAWNLPIPAVDANVERVFARLFDIDLPVKSVEAADFFRHTAEAMIPAGKARECSQALMEFGALVCRKKPLCEACPLTALCRAKRLGVITERPVPGKKTAYTSLEVVTGVLVHNGAIFLQKRLDSGVWAGFWEFPGGRLEPGETPEQGIIREYREETAFPVRVLRPLGVVRHAYTRYRIAMHAFLCALDEKAQRQQPPLAEASFPAPVLTAATAFQWVLPAALDAFTFPAGHRKLCDTYAEEIHTAAEASQAEGPCPSGLPDTGATE